MKTTIEINDTLLDRAKRHARKTGRPLRAIVEEGLRAVLDQDQKPRRYKLGDRSVGKKGGHNPLASLSWQDLRDEIYGRR